MHSQATPMGTSGNGNVLVEIHTHPFSIWIWPKLIGSLGALGVAALLPLAAAVARGRKSLTETGTATP